MCCLPLPDDKTYKPVDEIQKGPMKLTNFSNSTFMFPTDKGDQILIDPFGDGI